MTLVFWMLSFKPAFSLSSFTFIKRLFSSSSLSAIRVASSAYIRLLIFLLAILIPACDSFSLAFHMMYTAYRLNKQSDNIQPWHTSFPILNQSIVSCPVLTVASWPAYRFLRRQQLEPEMEKWTDSKLGKKYVKAVYCHPAYLTSMQGTSCEDRLDESQNGINIARRNINNLRYADDTTLMAQSEEELKASWWKWKRRVKKLA